MAPAPNLSRGLARAGWSIAGQSQDGSELPPDFDALGCELVSQVAKSWTSSIHFTIKQLGFDGKSAFHYECIFSCPSNELPVPSFVLSTRWALLLPSGGGDPRLFYSFEEGDLQHEWALVKDASVRPPFQFAASAGQQYCSLGRSSFEQYIHRLVHEKEQVRNRGVDLRTKFEETRLKKPPAYSEASSEDDSGSEGSKIYEEEEGQDTTDPTFQGSDGDIMREALKAAGLFCDKVEPPSSLAALLASIFDAADEENVGELPHYEVARLLSATLPGFGLELWDIHLLLTSAQENDDGFIECKPFIQAAPEIVQALCKRRLAYRSRGLPGVEVPQEAVKHCFTDEVTTTANQLLKIFEQMTQEDPSCGKMSKLAKEECPTKGRQRTSSGDLTRSPQARRPSVATLQLSQMEGLAEESLVGIRRRSCQDCLASLPERLSPQETMRLMQMLPEDEDGYIMIDELVEYLEHLRTDAMLNALVESDVLSLRTHLVLKLRRLGFTEEGKLNLWAIKDALLQADQVCLTRLQIHVLLCLATPDKEGLVDLYEFLGICCVIIPHMFDAKLFVDTAEHLILEHAENMRRAENEELAALGAAAKVKEGVDGEEVEAKVEVDPETVERTLQQVITLNDDQHRNPPSLPPEQIYQILCVNEKEIQSTQLSTFEIAGFVGEMQADEDGLVTYVEHIKKWVPIIFEQRKNRLLGRYMEVGCYETLGLKAPNLEELETMFPLKPYDDARQKQGSQRRSSRLRERRHAADYGSRRDSNASLKDSVKNTQMDSKGSKENNSEARRASHFRHSNVGLAGVGSKRRSDSVSKENIKEPPPGRGYERRKARMAAAEQQQIL